MDENQKKKWILASRNLSGITIPAFLWFVLGGSASVLAKEAPPIAYFGAAGIGFMLGVIQWSIITRKSWARVAFCTLIPINIFGSFWGWLSLAVMLIFWKKMWLLLKLRIKTSDLRNGSEATQNLL